MSSYLVKISQFGQRQSESASNGRTVQYCPLSEFMLQKVRQIDDCCLLTYAAVSFFFFSFLVLQALFYSFFQRENKFCLVLSFQISIMNSGGLVQVLIDSDMCSRPKQRLITRICDWAKYKNRLQFKKYMSDQSALFPK